MREPRAVWFATSTATFPAIQLLTKASSTSVGLWRQGASPAAAGPDPPNPGTGAAPGGGASRFQMLRTMASEPSSLRFAMQIHLPVSSRYSSPPPGKVNV